VEGHSSAANLTAAGLITAGLRNSFIGGLLSQRWLTYLGRRSYALYVIHQPLIVALMLLPAAKGLPALWLLAVPLLSIPLAELSWWFLESPFLKLKNRYESPSPGT
jgi:peptidoglycan/LPS O-acetylase OafA/YrhL